MAQNVISIIYENTVGMDNNSAVTEYTVAVYVSTTPDARKPITEQCSTSCRNRAQAQNCALQHVYKLKGGE